MEYWDWRYLPAGSFAVVIGMINTGKTATCRAFIQAQSDPAAGYAIHSAAEYDRRYTDFLSRDSVYDDHEIDTSGIIMRITSLPDLQSSPKFIIIDDCIWDPAILRGTWFTNLLRYCKSHRITLIVTMPYAMGLPPRITQQLDAVFVLRECHASNRRRIFDHYGIGLRDLVHLDSAMADAIEPYHQSGEGGCLVLTPTAQYRWCVAPRVRSTK